MKKRFLALTLLLALVLTLLASCGSEAAAPTAPADSTGGDAPANPDTVKIGVLLPLSGSYATSGNTNRYALETALDIINNEYGGIQNLGGARIEVVYGDTQGSPDVALTEMERLIESEKVDLLIGGHNSSVSATVAQYSMAYDMITMMTGAFADTAYLAPNDVVYHVAGCSSLDADLGIARENWKKENLPGYQGGKVYAYVYAADDYGRAAYEAKVAAMDAEGVEEIVGIPIESGATDLSAQLSKLKGRADIEYVTCAAGMADAIMFLRQCKEYDIAIPIFAGGAGFLVADFLDQVGDAGDYVYSIATFCSDWSRVCWDPARASELIARCKADLGYEPDESYAYMWEGIWTVWDVLERTASMDNADLKAALRETNIAGDHMALLMSCHDSITLPESYTSTTTGNVLYNQNPGYIPIWLMAKDGKYHIVYPENLADPDYPVVYPVPSWSER